MKGRGGEVRKMRMRACTKNPQGCVRYLHTKVTDGAQKNRTNYPEGEHRPGPFCMFTNQQTTIEGEKEKSKTKNKKGGRLRASLVVGQSVSRESWV